MLRREPTKITLTMDDIANYEARKAKKDAERQRQEAEKAGRSNSAMTSDPFGDFGRKPDTRSRDQRIGVGGSKG